MPRSPRRLPACLLGCALVFLPLAQAQAPRKPADDKSDDDKTLPIPPETTSVTHHDWAGPHGAVHYTATAGTLLIKDDKMKPNGSIFYTAYTADGAEAKDRPVTFFYNGGPGSATVWLHMGSFAPVRVLSGSPDPTAPPPYTVAPNPESLLDRSDLVFIDAPLAGFSRAAGKGTAKDFAGTDEDIRAFDKFIARWITVNGRWNSPKFLFGESYGTTRSGGLAAALNNDGIALNGVVLLSSILNYNRRSPGIDNDFTSYLPSYAAIAWHFNKVPHTLDLPATVEQARRFSRGEYMAALAQGDALPPAEFDAMATKLAAMTGLSAAYVKEAKLRVTPSHFRKELLRTDGRMFGRFDARFLGWDPDSAGEDPGYDPSSTGITGAYVSAFHAYIHDELKYQTDEPYLLSAPGVNAAWNFKHRTSGGGGEQPMPDTAMDLADAIRKNPKLHVFSANGWFDLATPFFGTEYDLQHMMLPPALQGNVRYGYYPAGHMVYLNVDALKQMKGDLDRFYTDALRH